MSADEVDARVVQGNRTVAAVRDDDADGEKLVFEVIDAKDLHLFFRVPGLGGDGDVFFLMDVDGGVGGRVLRGRWPVFES